MKIKVCTNNDELVTPDIFATTPLSGLEGPSRARKFNLLCRKTSG